MVSCGTFQKLSPLSLLTHLSSCYDSAHLRVTSGSVSWSLYLEEGKITYATHSIAAFDRLDCHLHRLGHKVTSVTSEIRAQISLIFENEPESKLTTIPEYQAICWLVDHQYLNTDQAADLIAGLVTEVVESFLLVSNGTYEFGEKLAKDQVFCYLNLPPIIEDCQKRLQAWESLGPQVWSPYQRLYFSRDKTDQQISPDIQQKLSNILKGFSFRHLAVLLNQDELQLAQSLSQYIKAGTILLQEPYSPFDQLPRTYKLPSSTHASSIPAVDNPLLQISKINHQVTSTPEKKFTNSQPSQFLPRTGEKSSPTREPKALSRDNITKLPVEQNNAPINNTVKPTAQPPAPINIPDTANSKSLYKIVCVDDSQAILHELNRCLEDEMFSVFTINNPIKALMQIMKIKPDLVLLDVNMAGIDGYELCRLLRNHSLFKNIPIIMVTANTGIFNRVKARVVGASGYLTKPFTQPDLLKIVFRHLS